MRRVSSFLASVAARFRSARRRALANSLPMTLRVVVSLQLMTLGKPSLEVLAQEEPLTLTEIAQRLRRTPGSTKDYLSWLEDVDLIVSRQKRYSFDDPMLRLWVRLHCRPVPPTEEDLARELHAYVQARLPHAEPALALTAAQAEREKNWGIIEID